MADLLIVCATHTESAPFLARYPGESSTFGQTGLAASKGKIGEKTYDLLITGPGSFNAAHALTAYLEDSTPELIVQTGIAGVFKETGFKIGDLAVATREQYIHTGIETGSIRNQPLLFDLIENKPGTREGVYPFDYALVNKVYWAVSQEAENHDIGLGKGLFLTVSSITSSFETATRIYEEFSPVMEAMEGAASAHVASLYDVPMIEIRAASNYVGEKDRSKWDIDLAAEQLVWALGQI